MAISLYVWDYIDPSLPMPQPDDAADKRTHMNLPPPGENDDTKTQKLLRSGLEKMTVYVQARLGPSAKLIWHKKKTLYPTLVALKERFTPDEEEYQLDLLNRYRRLREGPKRGNIDQWIIAFVMQADRCQTTFATPLLRNREAERDLFNNLATINENFGSSYRSDYSAWSIETICSKWDSYNEI